MINILIIEAAKKDLGVLTNTLQESHEVHILHILHSIQDTAAYLAKPLMPDLIIANTELPDGSLVNTFTQLRIQTPIVFMTEKGIPAPGAHTLNSIDYLAKPLKRKNIIRAIQKYKTLEAYFLERKKNFHAFSVGKNPKSRIIVRKGTSFKALSTNDIICFYTQNKVVYAVTREGQKFIYDKNLSQLEQEMDPSTFFRVNRQYVVNGQHINGFRNIDKIRIAIELSVGFDQKIIVSQDNAAAFRKWIYNTD